MILKIIVKFSLIIGIAVNGVSGAAYSKVYVQSGSEALPVEYIQYGIPSVSLAGTQIGQLTAGSVGQVVPVPSSSGLVAPCTMPCIYPGQVVSAVAPISASAPNIVSYRSSVPVVVPNKEETPGYEYSYVVYDENTGDHKSQYELSDGSTVHGEYSLLQPDGFVREVTYVADNTRGFNAIVKHFLPEREHKKKESNENTNQAQPCPEVKKDQPENTEDKQEKPTEENNQKLSKLVLANEEKMSIQKNDQKEPIEKNKSIKDINASKSKEEPVEKMAIKEKEPETDISKEIVNVALTKDIPKHQTEQPLIETPQHIKPAEMRESKPSPIDDKKDSVGDKREGELKDNTEVKDPKTEATPPLGLERTDIIVPYNDIIKCVEAAINGANKVPGASKSQSPLTYIVLNKPC